MPTIKSVDCACLVLQPTGEPVFDSEMENVDSLLRVPIRLLLRIGTLWTSPKKSQHPGCAVYTRHSSPGLKAEVFRQIADTVGLRARQQNLNQRAR